MSGQMDVVRILASTLDDDGIYDGLDLVLRAHLEDMVSMKPEIRDLLAVAAIGRAFGWSDDE